MAEEIGSKEKPTPVYRGVDFNWYDWQNPKIFATIKEYRNSTEEEGFVKACLIPGEFIRLAEGIFEVNQLKEIIL